MDAEFRDMLEGLRQAKDGLATTNEGIVLAARGMTMMNDGLTRAVAAAIEAHRESVDIRDTVTQLQQMVLDLTTEVRALRQHRNGQG